METGRSIRLNNSDEELIHAAANKLVGRVYGRDHFAYRNTGWDELPEFFWARVSRVVGGMAEEVGTYEFHLK
jgi:hypothetical protein